MQLTGTRNLADDLTSNEVALAREYLMTYGVERAAFVVRHALEAANAADFPGWTGVLPQDPAPRRTSPGGPEEGG